jgi:hypothetical protein
MSGLVIIYSNTSCTQVVVFLYNVDDFFNLYVYFFKQIKLSPFSHVRLHTFIQLIEFL